VAMLAHAWRWPAGKGVLDKCDSGLAGPLSSLAWHGTHLLAAGHDHRVAVRPIAPPPPATRRSCTQCVRASLSVCVGLRMHSGWRWPRTARWALHPCQIWAGRRPGHSGLYAPSSATDAYAPSGAPDWALWGARARVGRTLWCRPQAARAGRCICTAWTRPAGPSCRLRGRHRGANPCGSCGGCRADARSSSPPTTVCICGLLQLCLPCPCPCPCPPRPRAKLARMPRQRSAPTARPRPRSIPRYHHHLP
jgi:hypothetical protein